MGDPLNINRPYNESSGEKTSFSKKEKAKDYTGHTYSHEENPDAFVKKVSGVKDQTISKGGGLHFSRYDAAEFCKPREFHPFSDFQFKAFLEEKGIDGIQKFVESKGREKVAKAVKDSSFVQFAAEKGHLELVKYLVDELKCDANVVHDRFSPLISAAKEGHAEVVEFLLPHSSPSAFVDLQSHRAGVISYAAAAREPNQALIRSLIDNRDKFPIPIVGCIPVAVHLVQTNREQVTQWLKEKFNENVREGESDATLLARVVNLAHSFDKHALEIGVRDGEPLFVDLLLAAGTQPELGKKPAELTNNPLILRRLNEAQEAANSFRSRQLAHLLKHYASETMSPADQVLSWSTLIATLQAAPQLAPELEDLTTMLKRSLAMSFIVENPLFSAAEKRDYIRQQMDSLNLGEAILVNDHHQYGHHRVNLIEKREDQQWLSIKGDRYRDGSHNRQISDSRMNLNSEDAEMLILGQLVKGPSVRGKIMKKWQGAENNCVTQSDTVAFDYLLGEKLEQSKAVIYRQLKPLRVAYLSYALEHQGIVDSSPKVLHWIEDPKHAHLSELCPLVIPASLLRGFSHQELLNELPCFVTPDKEGNLSLWQKGNDVKTVPWQEWRTLMEGIPRENMAPARLLQIRQIQRLTGENSHLHFAMNDRYEATLSCDMFTLPVEIQLELMPTGVMVFKNAKGGPKILSNFESFWSTLPEQIVEIAKTQQIQPNETIVDRWVDVLIRTSFKKSYRANYPEARGESPPVDESWVQFGNELKEYLNQKWAKGNNRVIYLLLGHEIMALTEHNRGYLSKINQITEELGQVLNQWSVKKTAIRKEKTMIPGYYKKIDVPTVGLERPDRWSDAIQNKWDLAINRMV